MHARIIRVFVSSPGDMSQEREVLEEIVQTVNRDTGQSLGLRLELFRWEVDVVPQLGPKPQHVVDRQTPPYDVYLGILSTRFGTPTGRYGSGTEKEFKDALKNWKTAGSPWIAFYFDDAPTNWSCRVLPTSRSTRWKTRPSRPSCAAGAKPCLPTARRMGITGRIPGPW